jgi:hypothetical protein
MTRWLATYRQGGLSALLTVKTAPGATPKNQGKVLTKLQQQLASETGFSSYGAIVEWLREACDLDLKYDTVNRFVRSVTGSNPSGLVLIKDFLTSPQYRPRLAWVLT